MPRKPHAVIFVRAPEGVKARLLEAARESGRTLNAEIVWRLRQSLEGYRR